MKRFIVILTAFFCLSIAQDIAGTWNLTAVDVNYYNFARPNPATADAAFGEYQYQTPIYVYDTYGLGASLPLSWLPPGYMFLEVPNGPFGEAGLAANGVNLNVTLNSDGTGSIPEGSTYPDISLNEETCTTIGDVLPVTDAVIYSSDLTAGSVLPDTDIVGRPSRNRYAGEAIGSMSLSQSVVFSFVPADPVKDVSPIPLYFSATEPATSMTANDDGLYETIGTTSGFCKVDNFVGSVGDDGPLTVGDNVIPELGYYWHSIDGYSADTGFGDDGSIAQGGTDEDGDGTDYDRIFGLPAISATTIDAECAASFGFGDSFNHNVAGDIIEPLTGLVYDGCIAQVSVEVEAQCAGVELATGTAPYGAQATVTFLANTLLAAEAGSAEAIPTYVEGACDYISETAMAPVLCNGESDCPEAQAYAVAAFVEGLCLQAGFNEASCGSNADDPATSENEQGLANLVTVDYSVADCATLGLNASVLTAAAGDLVDSTDDNESGSNCDEWAPTVADGFAAQSADTGFQTCTDLAAGTAAQCASVTTTDNVPDASTPNYVYVMNPDPNYALWNQFVTFNGYAYSLTGDPSLLVDDSAWDLDPGDLTFLDLNNDGIDETPYSVNGGRLVFEYKPTCVPVIEAMEVQTEFVGIAAGECDNNGDLNGDGLVNVNDIIALVQYSLGNATLDDGQLCRADINGDSSIDVIDIVSIVQVILGNRGEAATSATFNRTESGLNMFANGVVDAIQVTLVHGDDFNIELIEGVSELDIAVASDSSKDNETTFIVVAPRDGEIARISGEYVIKEDGLLAANSNGYIATSMPTAFSLSEAYPNPFNPSTTLDLTLHNDGDVAITVYNVMGQMVGTLHNGNMSAGTHQITWDASNLASGMYIIKAEMGSDVVSNKVMLLK